MTGLFLPFPVRAGMRPRWRSWPGGIAARLAWTIVLALLLTQAVSALIYLTDRGAGGPPHDPRPMLRRMSAIVWLVERTPADQRPAVVGAVDAPGLSVVWQQGPPAELGRNDDHGFLYDMIRNHLRHAVGGPPRGLMVRELRGPPVPALGPGAPPRAALPGGEFLVGVQLVDRSWVVFTLDADRDGPFRLLRFALWMGLIGLVIVGVSWWAGRRLAAPFGAFARAAERLGMDGEAPLLAESGPVEVRQAIRAFNQMQHRLGRFVSDRTQMLAAISHDLRTPLTRLRLRAEFVEDAEQQQKMLADLNEMEAMIAATLAFSRDDARKEPRTRIDLAVMLASLADDLADAGQPVSYDGPAHRVVACRPLALSRAVSNLVDNAVKYGGVARISLTEHPGHVAIEVADDGPGVPEDEIEALFAPFYRLERSRSRDTGGTGLGLSVARTVARAHGGDVALVNRPGGGLTAILSLPYATE